MSNTVGSGAAGQAGDPAGNTPPANAQNQGGASQAPEWKAHIPPEFKEAKFWESVKDVPDLVKQFGHAQRFIGADKVVKPSADWKPEQWEEFHNQIGRPATPDKYTRLQDETKANVFSDEQTKYMTEAAHKLGLTDRQFSEYQKMVAGDLKESKTARENIIKESVTGHINALRQQHGAELPQVIAFAQKAQKMLADPELDKLIGENPALANHPSIVNLLSRIGRSLGEDQFRVSGINVAGGSPADARMALQKFEESHGNLIYAKDPSMLPGHEQKRRTELLKQRNDLFKQAYPQ